jgi:RNA recognition motif-containing protein
VFIPKKVDKWGRKFGFVKFKEVKEVEVMSEKLEDVWWDSYKLRINRARVGKGDKKEGDTSNRNQTQRLLVGNDLQVSDEMSYKTLLLEKDDMVERKLIKMVCW